LPLPPYRGSSQGLAVVREFGSAKVRSGQSRSFDGVCSMSELPPKAVATSWTAGPRIWLGVGTAALVMVATRSAVGAMLAGTALAAFARSFGL
jgi:hypothetical protein